MFYPELDLQEVIKKYYYGTSGDQTIRYFDIVQVGAGGNGGYLIQRLSKMLYAFSQNNEDFHFRYTIADGDSFEKKNLHRQPCIEQDIGLPKAKVMAERYSFAYDIPIYHKAGYIESTEELNNLFIRNTINRDDFEYVPILIGAVDNNASRQVMHQVFEESEGMIYIDAGIDNIDLEGSPKDIEESGYSGQVVVGFKWEKYLYLEPAGHVYPDIMEDKESRLPTQACGLTVVNYPQRMQTNELAALVMAGYMNTILGDLKILSHYTNFNARTMLIRPTYLEQEQVVKESKTKTA